MVLRSDLLVITGSIHVEGGDTHSVRQKGGAKSVNGVATHVLTHKRVVTEDRRKANVISTEAMRQVRKLRVLWTPFGSLVPADKQAEVRELIETATRRAAEFNDAAGPNATARLTNCLLCERLRAPRLASVEGWIAREILRKNPDVTAAVSVLAAP